MAKMRRFGVDHDESKVFEVKDPEAVESDGGDLENTVVSFDKEDTEVTSWTDFVDKCFNTGAKIGQWFRDFREGAKYLLHVGNIINNCTTDDAASVLAAAQGKVLQDQITSLNSDIASLNNDLSDLNTIEEFSSKCTFDQTPARAFFYKMGNIVSIMYQGISTSLSANSAMFTVPEGYRPYPHNSQYFAIGYQANSDSNINPIIVQMDASGVVTCLFGNGNGRAYINWTYFTDE